MRNVVSSIYINIWNICIFVSFINTNLFVTVNVVFARFEQYSVIPVYYITGISV